MIRELADALHQRERVVHFLTREFPEDARDRIWIPEVSRRGWIIVT